jgi:homoserine dehydrogenase
MKEGMSYEDALKKAQELGFAEPDPTFDVEGLDASQKLAILSSLAFNHKINDKIHTEGISKLSKLDIKYANELGYEIKLLAIGKKLNGEIELRVHPTMISKSHELCSVINEFNAIYINGENITDNMLYGKGAGQLPTATVIIGDIIDIANNNKILNNSFNDITIKDINSIESRYYLRLKVPDVPGVLAKFSKVLGDNNISISGVQQKELEKEIVPIVILTHKAIEKDINKAIKEIEELDIVKEKPILIRIEDM